MLKLLNGILQFQGSLTEQSLSQFAALALEAKPDFIYLGCGDSRVDPRIFASLEAGDAFVNRNSAMAREVLGEDDDVDRLNVQLFRELLTYMIEEPRNVARALRITFIAKYLERIADHATNIAQMVIFLCEGTDVRHTPAGRGSEG